MKILIAVIVGAIIGYFTNMVAIKMLFRPYEEKYIFGLKLPFTPGLIPKEQDRIARSVGETVEDYLLSPEIILESLGEKNIEEAIRSEIDTRLNYHRNKETDLADLLEELGLDQSRLELVVEEFLLARLKKSRTSDSLRKSLEELLDLEPSKLIERLMEDQDLVDMVYRGLEKNFENTSNNERSLEDLVGQDRFQALLDYIDENQNLLAYRLRKFIGGGEVRASIESTIGRVLEDNMPGLVIGLISMDLIASRIYQAFEDYLRGPEASGQLNEFLSGLVVKAQGLSLGQVKLWLDKNLDREKLLENLAEIISQELGPEEISRLLEGRADLGRTLIDQVLEGLYSSDLARPLIKKISKDLAARISSKKLMDLCLDLGLDRDRLYSLGLRIFKGRLKDKLPGYIEKLELGRIVEKTIREFDCEFAEKLVLDIASKELKAITRLGGVLGGLIGLISPLLQML